MVSITKIEHITDSKEIKSYLSREDLSYKYDRKIIPPSILLCFGRNNGEKIKPVILKCRPPFFYVAKEELNKLPKTLQIRYKIRSTDLLGYDGKELAIVEVEKSQNVAVISSFFSKTYEGGEFLFNGNRNKYEHHASLYALKNLGNHEPLRIMMLDIETLFLYDLDPVDGIFMISFYDSFLKTIYCIVSDERFRSEQDNEYLKIKEIGKNSEKVYLNDGECGKIYEGVYTPGEKYEKIPVVIHVCQNATFQENEKQLLNIFLKYFKTYRPCVSTGWNALEFDWSNIFKRCLVHGINPSDFSEVGKSGFEHKKTDEGKIKIPYIYGHEIFDLMNAFTQYNQSKNYISLEFASLAEKLPEKLDPGKAGPIMYNIHDVWLCIEIDKKNNLINYYDMLRRELCSNFNTVMSRSRVITIAYFRFTKLFGRVLPTKLDLPPSQKEGARVFEQKMGEFRSKYDENIGEEVNGVAMFDVASMYVAIMILLNISPETLDITEFKKPSNSRNPFKLYKRDELGIIPRLLILWYQKRVAFKHKRDEYNGNAELFYAKALFNYLYKKREDITEISDEKSFSDIIAADGFWIQRSVIIKIIGMKIDEALETLRQNYSVENDGEDFFSYLEESIKNEKNGEREETLQQVYKSLMNSIYGVYGYENFFLYNPITLDLVTYVGRMIISHIKEIIEEEGHENLYGDTDSVFALMRKFSDSFELEKIINTKLKELVIKMKWRDDFPLTVKFEKWYSFLLLPGIKKRYFGLYTYLEGEAVSKIDIKGFESKRADSSVFTRYSQSGFMNKICYEGKNSAQQFLRDAYLSFFDMDLEEIGIKKNLKKDPYTGYKFETDVAKAAKYSNEYLGGDFKAGSRGYLVYLKSTGKLPLSESFLYLKKMSEHENFENLEIDYKKTLSKTFFKKIESIFLPLDMEWRDVFNFEWETILMGDDGTGE